MSHEAVLQPFESHQRAKGLSPATIGRRRYSLQKLAVFASPVPLLDVTPDLIEEWLGTYRAAETKHAYLADVRALFKWARRRGLVDVDPTENMDGVRRARTLPRPISEDDLALAIVTARDPRLKLVLLFGSLAGLRRSEISRMRAEDCTERSVVVRGGKGAKDGVIPMHPYLWSALHDYGIQHGWLFEAAGGGPVRPGTISGWVSRHFEAIGVTATLHQTRHRFGTKIADVCNGNMLVVRELLRHANFETSGGYVAFDTSRLRPIVDELPVAGA